MRIALGSDHRGDAACLHLAEHLRGLGHEVTASGPGEGTRRDYPDHAYEVATRVAGGGADLGVLVCGSGTGMAIAANKVAGIRAAVARDAETAVMSRRHNDANVLCLSADGGTSEQLGQVVDAWLQASFDGGRHETRVSKIGAIERGDDPREQAKDSAPARHQR